MSSVRWRDERPLNPSQSPTHVNQLLGKIAVGQFREGSCIQWSYQVPILGVIVHGVLLSSIKKLWANIDQREPASTFSMPLDIQYKISSWPIV